MTTADKPVTRITYARHRGRPIIVTIRSTWLELRLKGTRRRYQLDTQAAFELACKIAANDARREAQEAKKTKAAERRAGR